jgi:carbamoyl-phosphate synthase large subunit
MIQNIKVLISAAGSPAAISIVRYLKSKGYYVVGIDANSDTYDIGEWSCDEFYLSPLATAKDYIPFIIEKLTRCDVFLPFIDEELRAISESNMSVDILTKVMISSAETIRLCTDKIKFQTFCEKTDLSIAPRTDCIPAVYKPQFGRGGKGVAIIDDDEFLSLYRKKKGVIQTYLSGKEYTVDCYFDDNSKLLQAVSRQRVLATGVSTIGIIDLNKEVLNLVEKVANNIDFTGLVNMQVMLTNGGPYLIEINPRLSGSLIFTILSGADFLSAYINSKVYATEYLNFEVSAKKITRYWSEYETSNG